MNLSRRDFIKSNAVAAAAASVGLPLAAPIASVAGQQIRWDKAPCRFCGTGCSVLVGTKDGRIVATQGDPDAPVNKGLNCIKGYFLSKIVYGDDRLKTPLLRKKNGKFDKNGEFTPVGWKEALDLMEEKWKTALKQHGPESIGMFGSGQWTVWEGVAAVKLMKAGFRSNNIDPNARHCMASAAVGFMRTFGIDEPMGCYDDIEHADAFVLWGSNMAEMHPILWQRIAERRLAHPHVRVAVLSTFEHRSYELADLALTFTPQADLAILNFVANSIIQRGAVNKDFVSKHVAFRLGNTDIGYGLRPEHPLQKAAKNAADPGGFVPISFEEFAKFVARYDLKYAAKLSGVPAERLREVARHYDLFGGVSPLNGQNRALISALEAELAAHGPALPVYWGNRNWHPLLEDTLRRMTEDGVRRALAFVSSAFSSYSGCRQYREDVERARAAVGAQAPVVEKLRAFYDHPGFIEANAERVRTALAHWPAAARAGVSIAFTAHSIPLAMASGCAMSPPRCTASLNVPDTSEVMPKYPVAGT